VFLLAESGAGGPLLRCLLVLLLVLPVSPTVLVASPQIFQRNTTNSEEISGDAVEMIHALAGHRLSAERNCRHRRIPRKGLAGLLSADRRFSSISSVRPISLFTEHAKWNGVGAPFRC
jgi:hypothetical protein